MPRTLLVALLALSPATAFAQQIGPLGKAGAILESDTEAETEKPWSVNVSLADSQSAAIDQAVVTNGLGLDVGGSWRFNRKMSLSASAGWGVDLTTPHSGVRSDFGALGATFNYSNIWKDKQFTGISVSARASLAMPIGYSEAATPEYPSPGVGLTFSRSLYGVSLSYGISYSRDLPMHSADLVKCIDYGDGATCPPDLYRTLQNGFYPTRDSLGQHVSIGYQPLEKLSFSMGFSYGLDWSFAPGSASLDTSGQNKSATNLHDRIGFSLGAGYTINDHYGVNFSLNNSTASRPNGQGLLEGSGSSTIPTGLGALLFNKKGTMAALSVTASY